MNLKTKPIFLFVTDNIRSFNPKKEATLSFINTIQSKGLESYICRNKDLFLDTDTAKASAKKITLNEEYKNKKDFYTLGNKKNMELTDFGAIFQRTNPPIDKSYLYTALILDKVASAGVIMVNPPLNLLLDNEKLLATKFSEFIPPAIFSANKDMIKDFSQQYEKIILKPADGFGGKDIFLTHKEDPNLNAIIDNLSDEGKLQIIAQKYIPEIKDGDKRILIINGEVFPKCSARIPQGIDHRGNNATGGISEIRTLTEQDTKIAKKIATYLKDNNIRLAGIDVIGEYLTEINITSPGGLNKISEECNPKPTDLLIDGILQDLERLKSEQSDKQQRRS